jgi:transposase
LTGHGRVRVNVSMASPDGPPSRDDGTSAVSGDAVIEAAENALLRAENAALMERLPDLERRLGLNSSNSGKPPSSDGPCPVPLRPIARTSSSSTSVTSGDSASMGAFDHNQAANRNTSPPHRLRLDSPADRFLRLHRRQGGTRLGTQRRDDPAGRSANTSFSPSRACALLRPCQASCGFCLALIDVAGAAQPFNCFPV